MILPLCWCSIAAGKYGFGVGVHDPVPVGFLHVLQQREMSDTSIIDKYLRIGIDLENLAEHGADRGIIRDIAGEGMDSRVMLFLQLTGQGMQSVHLFIAL